jgi:hypothetical protein
MENDNVYRKIQEFFTGLNNNFSLIEDPVDVAVQMNYFETSARLRGDVKEDDMLARKNELFDPNVSVDKKKLLLVQMASVPSPEIFRVLENFVKNSDADLEEWSKLALQENKLLLESFLLDSRQVFISTGLGGKGHKLRYFVVLINKNGSNLKPFEQKVLHDEMSYALQKYDSELEKLNFMQYYTTMRVVVPISSDLSRVFREGIDECNQFGNFLSSEFIVTNMKELSEEEINEALSVNNPMITDDDFPPVD